jgi:hypothetical protein
VPTSRLISSGPLDGGFRSLVDTLEGEPGRGILPYALLYNDHSGIRDARVQQTAIRVVCANTLEWALSREKDFSTAVPHWAGVQGAFRAAVQSLFRELVPGYQALADQRAVLKGTILSGKEFSQLVLDRLPRVPLPPPSPGAPWSGGLKGIVDWMEERRRARQVEVRRLWEEGAGHRGDHSAWEAYNGLVQWLDHSPFLDSGEERLSGLLNGQLSQTKQQVYARLLAHAMDRRGGNASRGRRSWKASLQATAPTHIPSPLSPAGSPAGKP